MKSRGARTITLAPKSKCAHALNPAMNTMCKIDATIAVQLKEVSYETKLELLANEVCKKISRDELTNTRKY